MAVELVAGFEQRVGSLLPLLGSVYAGRDRGWVKICGIIRTFHVHSCK